MLNDHFCIQITELNYLHTPLRSRKVITIINVLECVTGNCTTYTLHFYFFLDYKPNIFQCL